MKWLSNIKMWWLKVTGQFVVSKPEYLGTMTIRKDVEVIPSTEPFVGHEIKILTDNDPIEEFDSWAGQFKGTTKIDNTLWGVIELDPEKWMCNGKRMSKEEFSQALWDGTWHVESDTTVIHGRRHLASYILNKKGVCQIPLA